MSLEAVIVWSERDSPRLRYVLDWLLGERLGLQYRLTHDKEEAAAASCCMAYGWLEEVPSIHASSLLWETGVTPQTISRREWQGLHTLYHNEESPCDIQFDMLSGIFYLLSRYEEYTAFTRDRHGRYPAEQSILFGDGVLERPIVDEWVEALRIFLQETWQVVIPPRTFSYQPSYDIDIAWSYQFKGWERNLGAGLRDLATGHFARLTQRLRVLRGQETDPYNGFVWLATQHMSYGIQPMWFFLAALRPSRFDKNIPPTHPRMAALIKAFSGQALTGVHPSYYSDVQPGRLREEKAVLESIIGRRITISRQHFIKVQFPQTYHALIAAGIEEDYSMGYSTHFGFRAGTSAAFRWYDLSNEGASELRVHPFAFMDTTAHYDLGLSPEAAFDCLRRMRLQVEAVHGRLITIMHNFSVGTEPEWKGWRTAYERFLGEVCQ